MKVLRKDERPSIRPFILGLRDSIPESVLLGSRECYRLAGRNTGNFAFTAAIKQQLTGWDDPPNVHWADASSCLRKQGRICVIPGANKLGPHQDLGGAAAILERAEIPIVVVTLGAQSNTDYRIPEIPEGTLSWIRAIVDRRVSDCENIGVRGEFSRTVLASYGFDGARVIGCPSLFLNPSNRLGSRIMRKARVLAPRVAVAAGGPGRGHLAGIERSLIRMVTATDGAYICQAPLAMTALARGDYDELDDGELDSCRTYVDPDMTVDQFKRWTRRHAVVFFDVWAWMEFLRDFDFVVGTRIHGVLLGMQVGVPGLCIVSDSRTRELCETMNIPHVFARDWRDGFDCEQMSELFREQFDGSRFDSNRRALAANYVAFLVGNRLQPTEELRALAASPRH